MKVNKSISLELDDFGKIEELVLSSEYKNVSDFIQEAVIEKLERIQKELLSE